MPMDTALHKAAKDGDIDGMKDCLDDNIGINEQGAQGRTALHRALGGGFHEASVWLMENGADPLIADSLKRTSLHWAAMAPPPGNLECVKLMFDKSDGKSMLAKKTKSGSTPLHSAAVTNRHNVIQLLLDNGADESLEDDDGFTAYDQAKQEGHSDVLALLQVKKGSGGGGGGGAWTSPFAHGIGSSWHSWDSGLVLLLFCRAHYLLLLACAAAVYARSRSRRAAAAAALALACVMWLNHVLGLSVFEGLICRPWIWLIMG
mmetsp:Transcript_66979/g.178228  ORF Transcript_66979/g.178228 Transcript_66979/m.178228 type:complete len:261 (-) Transcript_66979:531-1313(-)